MDVLQNKLWYLHLVEILAQIQKLSYTFRDMRVILLNIILIVHVSLSAQDSLEFNLTRIVHNADFNYSGINNLNNLSAEKQGVRI